MQRNETGSKLRNALHPAESNEVKDKTAEETWQVKSPLPHLQKKNKIKKLKNKYFSPKKTYP